ncbi:MAG TPA: glutamate 5-kinase [Bacteroidota bacterium]|nr:glutamate 5-kinase [Bacteroidota bacterium]
MLSLEHILGIRKKIVIKIGTNLLTDKTEGLHTERIEQIAQNVSALHSRGYDVVIVSSGAIGAGVGLLRLAERPRTIPEKQAVAAIGQPILMEAYEHAFRKEHCTIAQILLTKDDFVNRSRYINIKNTFSALFDKGVVPIVNENDSVAVEEIKLGDNDNLSALVATLVEAGILIILSDVDGLYSDDPARNSDARLIPVVEKISPQIEKLAKGRKNDLSTGGMITKIQAARRCTSSGIAVVIANGTRPNVIADISVGKRVGTLFLPAEDKLNVRQKWIGFVSDAKGTVAIDDGAKTALIKKQKSLLPSGIIDVRGEFKRGDTISVVDMKGIEIARGVAGYSSTDLGKIKGKKTAEIQKILNRQGNEEVIHRNDLVMTGPDR